MSTQAPASIPIAPPPGCRIAVVAARFNDPIVAQLLSGCLDRLAQLGLAESAVEVHRVPGAFELPLAAQALARTRRFSAVICLGCLIRGQTPHFDYVAGPCADGIARVALAENLPVLFGVLTVDNESQAQARVIVGGEHGHAGVRAADAAVEMAALLARVTQ